MAVVALTVTAALLLIGPAAWAAVAVGAWGVFTGRDGEIPAGE